MFFKLDPAKLPALDIVGLATSGLIVRAERETPADGIPAFITRPGWEELLTSHAADVENGSALVLPPLEKAVQRLLAHAAQSASEEQNFAPLVTLESDLFASAPSLLVMFVRDQSHPVACVLVGTEEHIATTLKGRAQTL
ncbi:hypothetical protein AA106555_0944 [Neokomagataea thailandica NBRC 106555]|uniref:Uncharacterized protein n=2 Tax=Neokomagataea TaxID=1223423 RepID=A0A4Y6V5W3_9PROT|nr:MULTISPECIES: hypothetical protein [Neokomagataea]QDH25323.1 hypothetical protein D5366_09000 [Neokomagataea tanensis]GBR52515.1 hypothetical protein AA106555_0944 [Neokomagataea thailandica NBRC 106555]